MFSRNAVQKNNKKQACATREINFKKVAQWTDIFKHPVFLSHLWIVYFIENDFYTGIEFGELFYVCLQAKIALVWLFLSCMGILSGPLSSFYTCDVYFPDNIVFNTKNNNNCKDANNKKACCPKVLITFVYGSDYLLSGCHSPAPNTLPS